MTRWAAEQEAYRGIADLLAQAEHCKQLCDRAGLALPEPLKRLLGTSEGTAKTSHGLVIPPPPVRSRPPGIGDDWISVHLANAAQEQPSYRRAARSPGWTARAKDICRKGHRKSPAGPFLAAA